MVVGEASRSERLGWSAVSSEHPSAVSEVSRGDCVAAGLGFPLPTRSREIGPARLGWPGVSRETPGMDATVETGAQLSDHGIAQGVAHVPDASSPTELSTWPAEALQALVEGVDVSVDAGASDVDVSRETDSSGRPAGLVAPREGDHDNLDGSDVSRETGRRWEDDPEPSTNPTVAPAPTAPDDGSLTDTPLMQAVAADAKLRQDLDSRVLPRPAMTRVLTVANQKGGVGKTTTTVNVAAALAFAGMRVLVIDLDPQGNASTALGIDHRSEVTSIYDVLVDGVDLAEIIQPCPDVDGLFCAPATIDLAGSEIELVSLVARETRLRKAVTAYLQASDEPIDYILIDCPPSLGLLTVNAFVAAKEVFIPIQCEYYALEGLSQLLKNIDLIRTHLNPDLHVSTILMTMYDARTRLSAQVAAEVRAHFPAETLEGTVPRSVRVSEAPSHGQTVITYDPSSSGALAYRAAAAELAERGASPATQTPPDTNTPEREDTP